LESNWRFGVADIGLSGAPFKFCARSNGTFWSSAAWLVQLQAENFGRVVLLEPGPELEFDQLAMTTTGKFPFNQVGRFEPD